jgi:hypothetical protein
MNPLLSIRRLGIITALTVPATVRVNAQELSPNRLGLGVTGIAGSFGTYSSGFIGAEGFVRVARGSFWSARVDGAYLGAVRQTDHVCPLSPSSQGCDLRFLGQLGMLNATLALGPSAPSGLRPFYGLLGVGGAVTRWGGGGYVPPHNAGTSSEVIDVTGWGPSFALFEAGIGSEFRALGGNRIEFRMHRVSGPTPTGRDAPLGSVVLSLTIGVVW